MRKRVSDLLSWLCLGNPLGKQFLQSSEAFYNLVYVELAACRLRDLPTGLSKLLPNVRAINLNYNFLEDSAMAQLEGLKRLRKLTVIGSRLNSTKGIIRVLRGMSDVEMLDLRYGKDSVF